MNKPYIDLIFGPCEEPLTVAEVKTSLGIANHALGDYHIECRIKQARLEAEDYLGCALITQTWQVQYDRYAPQLIRLPKGPIQKVRRIKIISSDFGETFLSEFPYTQRGDTVIFDAIVLGMIVQIQYETGYGNRQDVPEKIREGMMAHVAMLLQQQGEDLPLMSTELYAQYKKFKI